ncbi:MAG: hypothetical protein QXQ96_10695 [Sulfolobales archaeon]
MSTAQMRRDLDEIEFRLERAMRSDDVVKGFTRATKKYELIPYSLMVVDALRSDDPPRDLERQYIEGYERTRRVLEMLRDRVRIYMRADDASNVKIYAWSYREGEVMLLLRFGNSMRILDERPEVEPIYIKIRDGKISVGTRVHYKTVMWFDLDRADILINPLGHTPVVINKHPDTGLDLLRGVWVYLSLASAAQPIKDLVWYEVYRLDGEKLSSGEKTLNIEISSFFKKVPKRHELPEFVRKMLKLKYN